MATPALGPSLPETVSVSKLDLKNSDWTLYNRMYNQVELLYEGGVRLQENVSNFLIKRPKELFDVYQERARRLTYQNILSNCIGWYLAKLFQIEPQIDGNTDDERFANLLQDCDRSGTTFIDFSRHMIETAMLYRRAFVLIDKPQPGELPVMTRADEKAQRLDEPYLVMYEPKHVFNWSQDQYGNLDWIVIKTLGTEQAGPLEAVTNVAHWWIFDRQNFYHYQYKQEQKSDPAAFFSASAQPGDEKAFAMLADFGPHSLAAENRVPIRVMELPMHLWFTNRSYLHLLEHIDTLNGLAWKLFMCNHPQLVIQTDDDITGQTMSEVSFLKFHPADKIFYLEPDGKTFGNAESYLDRMREEIYRGFHLQAQAKQSTATADGASGYSKEMEMAPAVDVLNALGDILRASQQLIMNDYKAAAGMPVEGDAQQVNVNGYRFETKPALQDITVAQALIDTGVTDKSPTLEKVVDKHIALSVADGEDEDTKQKITDEIENAPTRKEVKDAEQQAQADAFQKTFQRATAKNVLGAEASSIAA